MTKIRKIIATAAAAVSIGAFGLTAFAASPNYNGVVYPFHFDIGDGYYGYLGLGYSDPAPKRFSSTDAQVLVERGDPAPSRSNPLEAFVATKKDTGSKYHATETVEFYSAADNYLKFLKYYSGMGVAGADYYLCALCGEYNLNVSGVWCP